MCISFHKGEFLLVHVHSYKQRHDHVQSSYFILTKLNHSTCSFYCDGLFRHISAYDFVGIMGKNFYEELDRMGQRYGERVASSLEHIFHMEKARNETNHGIERSASVHVLDFYTPKVDQTSARVHGD